MQIAENPDQAFKVRWYYAAPGALDLGIPTPFMSRNWEQWTLWPEIGEVEFATRELYDGSFPIVVPGTGTPCGSLEAWAGELQGVIPPDYPRNMFGLAACCGGLIAPLGSPTFGLQVQIGFSVTPVTQPGVVGQEVLRDDNLEETCGTLDAGKKAVYPAPFVPKELSVDPLDDSYDQRKLIFGGEE
mgnify:CR=1 FL=1